MITLKEHIERLQELVKENPEYLELPLIYGIDLSSDNEYKEVEILPDVFYYDSKSGDIRRSLNGFTEESKLMYKQVICIN